MQLQEWLDHFDPSFEDGLQLLQEYGISEVKIDTIRRLEGTRLGFSMMREWLEPMAAETPVNKPVILGHIFSKDEDIKALDETRRRHYKTANHLFGSVIKNPNATEEERRVAALEILDTFEKHVDPIWKDLKYYQDHGQLPDTNYLTPPKETSIIDKIKRRNTLRTYLSKFANDAKKADKRVKWQEELDTLDAEIKAANQ